jgi:hypothetical protein
MGRLGSRGDVELAEDRRHVVPRGLGRDEQPLRDLRIREPFAEQPEDLGLSGSQPCRMRRRRTPWPLRYRPNTELTEPTPHPGGQGLGPQPIEGFQGAAKVVRVVAVRQGLSGLGGTSDRLPCCCGFMTRCKLRGRSALTVKVR